MFQDKIKDLPNFSDIFIHGSTNYRKSAVDDLARSKKGDPKHPHTVAYNKYLSIRDVELKSRSKTLAETANKQNTDFLSSFGNMSEQTLLKLRIKFETTYFTVKNKLPISACKNILRLEEKHVVVERRKYPNDSSIRVFINYIGGDLKQQLSSEIVKAKFSTVSRFI